MFHERHSCLLQEPRERGRSLYLSRGEGGAFAYRDHHPRLPTRQRSILPVEARAAAAAFRAAVEYTWKGKGRPAGDTAGLDAPTLVDGDSDSHGMQSLKQFRISLKTIEVPSFPTHSRTRPPTALPTSLEAFSSCLDPFSPRLAWSDRGGGKAGKEGWGRVGAGGRAERGEVGPQPFFGIKRRARAASGGICLGMVMDWMGG